MAQKSDATAVFRRFLAHIQYFGVSSMVVEYVRSDDSGEVISGNYARAQHPPGIRYREHAKAQRRRRARTGPRSGGCAGGLSHLKRPRLFLGKQLLASAHLLGRGMLLGV